MDVYVHLMCKGDGRELHVIFLRAVCAHCGKQLIVMQIVCQLIFS